MAQERRILSNFKFGTLSAGISNSATTVTSAAFASLPAISGTADYIPLTLFDASTQVYEIVWVTAHTASSTSATVVRGREGTGGLAWALGANWAHTPTIYDGLSSATSGTLPSSPFVGQRVVETDTTSVKVRTLGGWQAGAGVALPADVGPNEDGTNPPAGAVIQMRAGAVTANTNSVAEASIAFRTTFPTNCLTVVASPRDKVNMGGDIVIFNTYASGFDFKAIYPNGTDAVSLAVQVAYIAVGW